MYELFWKQKRILTKKIKHVLYRNRLKVMNSSGKDLQRGINFHQALQDQQMEHRSNGMFSNHQGLMARKKHNLFEDT